MHIVATMLCVMVLAFVIMDFVREYRRTPGSVWDRAVAAGKGSATILWARFVAIVSALAALLVEFADYLNAPGVAEAIKGILQPEYVGLFMVAIAIITEFARRRTL